MDLVQHSNLANIGRNLVGEGARAIGGEAMRRGANMAVDAGQHLADSAGSQLRNIKRSYDQYMEGEDVTEEGGRKKREADSNTGDVGGSATAWAGEGSVAQIPHTLPFNMISDYVEETITLRTTIPIYINKSLVGNWEPGQYDMNGKPISDGYKTIMSTPFWIEHKLLPFYLKMFDCFKVLECKDTFSSPIITTNHEAVQAGTSTSNVTINTIGPHIVLLKDHERRAPFVQTDGNKAMGVTVDGFPSMYEVQTGQQNDYYSATMWGMGDGPLETAWKPPQIWQTTAFVPETGKEFQDPKDSIQAPKTCQLMNSMYSNGNMVQNEMDLLGPRINNRNLITMEGQHPEYYHFMMKKIVDEHGKALDFNAQFLYTKEWKIQFAKWNNNPLDAPFFMNVMNRITLADSFTRRDFCQNTLILGYNMQHFNKSDQLRLIPVNDGASPVVNPVP